MTIRLLEKFVNGLANDVSLSVQGKDPEELVVERVKNIAIGIFAILSVIITLKLAVAFFAVKSAVAGLLHLISMTFFAVISHDLIHWNVNRNQLISMYDHARNGSLLQLFSSVGRNLSNGMAAFRNDIRFDLQNTWLLGPIEKWNRNQHQKAFTSLFSSPS